ncbi:MAG: DUF1963 domain-containing protein [Planctomycetes bacterium]|nr:DUF1963 domain-containing protein [Planctomycetota bacterium]
MWPFRKKNKKEDNSEKHSAEHAQLLKAIAPWKTKHMRQGWRPIAQIGTVENYKCQFGGIPFVETGMSEAVCPLCGKAPPLFLQLDSRELPESRRTFGDGLLQLYYCTSCEGDGEGWNAHSAVSQFRILRSRELHRANTPLDSIITPRTIVRWEPFEDYPSTDESEEMGVTIGYDFKNDLVNVECRELGLVMKGLSNHINDLDMEVAEAISSAASGDKLGGWPHWIQSPEYPSCPECGSIMEHFFQIDSGDHLEYMFGDAGCGHITQCPKHRGRFAFGWACC